MMSHAHALFLGGFAELAGAVAELGHCLAGKFAGCGAVGVGSGDAHTDEGNILRLFLNLEKTFLLIVGFLELFGAYRIFLGVELTEGKICVVHA